MTVLDTSAVVDFLLGESAAREVEALLAAEPAAAAPDVLVLEVLAVLRRYVRRGLLPADRAGAAVEDLGDLAIDLFPSLALRQPAWELRDNFAAADALFVALAQLLGEPLATKDGLLASAARTRAGIETIHLAHRD